ncbi:unnamed protein product [Caenorhabditis angaria]|uniref:Zinc metalloproteinase n=1 Tax=Caenorhabditis angaria TaxID=860376 RepID=A0A9P1IB09_9PELO|nr:unnamed protein product [Caenorhabditis angaria]
MLSFFVAFILLFFGSSFQASFQTSKDLKLFDILKPSDTHRLFDTLQYTVEEQYSNSHLSFDVSTFHNYAEKPISIQKLNSKYSDVLYEGDMAISYKQLEKIVNGTVDDDIKFRLRKFLKMPIRPRRQAYLDDNYPATIWNSGVPFVFHSSLSSLAKDAILRAIHFWYRETCIEFKPRTFQEEYLLFVGNDEGCWSTVGKDKDSGKQVVSIGTGCEHFGVTSHELAHALGLFHEQSRYDRDDSITFNPRVVDTKLLFNFAKISSKQLSTYNAPYDIGSVMHYTPTEFSQIKTIPSLTAVDSNLQQTMGQLEGPSFIDILLVNQHYKCQEKCARLADCKNGGFTNSRNCRICKCPSGFGGDLCENVQKSFSKSCGGIIQAEKVVRRFDMTIKQEFQKKDKMCAYHLQSPPNTKIVIKILELESQCIEGCWKDGSEFKMRKDVRPLGYRFCCPDTSKREMVSDNNIVPFMLYSRDQKFKISFEYSYIDNFVQNDDIISTTPRTIITSTNDLSDGIHSQISI